MELRSRLWPRRCEYEQLTLERVRERWGEEAIASVTAQRDWDATEGQLDRRKRRYETESDPLYLEWQYDKTPESEQAWRDKVAEIKAQLPIGVNPPITE